MVMKIALVEIRSGEEGCHCDFIWSFDEIHPADRQSRHQIVKALQEQSDCQEIERNSRKLNKENPGGTCKPRMPTLMLTLGPFLQMCLR